MRLSQTPPSLLSLVFLLSNIDTAQAGPYPKDFLHDFFGGGFLQDRGCDSYCGATNQYCCTVGQGCFTTTSNAMPVAFCSLTAAHEAATVGAGGSAVYTTTWTETGLVTHTSTVSTFWAAATSTYVAPASGSPKICDTSLGQTSCDTICCASNQECGSPGSCVPRKESSIYPTDTAIKTSSSYSAPIRPTSGGVSTATSTVSATTTAAFIPPATASGSTIPIVASSSHGLSGGAIAGIVIGVIVGIILLILICFCCIVRAGLSGLLAIFGLGKKKHRSTETVEVIEERYSSRHGSGTASRRDHHNGWFGAGAATSGGGRRPAPPPKKKSSGLGGLGMVGAGLLGMAAVLGLKRKSDKKSEKPPRSDISSSYYTDSYTGTSASSASSDRRTRRTSDTRHTRHTSRR